MIQYVARRRAFHAVAASWGKLIRELRASVRRLPDFSVSVADKCEYFVEKAGGFRGIHKLMQCAFARFPAPWCRRVFGGIPFPPFNIVISTRIVDACEFIVRNKGVDASSLRDVNDEVRRLEDLTKGVGTKHMVELARTLSTNARAVKLLEKKLRN